MFHDLHNHEEGGDSKSSSSMVSNLLSSAAIGVLALGTAVVLAPHVLPVLGIGGGDLAEEAATILHHDPTGLAGGINGLLGAVPFIGAELAKGGMFTALASAGVGLGGVLAARFIEKQEDGSKKLKLSKIIRWGALATSALIALPTILTALGTGMIYLSMLVDSATLNATNISGLVAETVGSIGGEHQTAMLGASGVAAALPHLLLCCTSMLPAALSLKFWHDDKEDKTEGQFASRVGTKRKLQPNDPNLNVTEEEKRWVEAYNSAPPPIKKDMQGWLRDKGYNPDFHADGTVHLYQHAHARG